MAQTIERRRTRILLVGCGGIGTILAARLEKAGADLAIVTGSAATSQSIREHGLRVQEIDGQTWSIKPQRPPVEQAIELAEQAPFDLCLLVTKTTTLDLALKDALTVLAPSSSVVCLQNGLPEDRACLQLPPSRVIGCVVSWGATLQGPAQSTQTSRGGFRIGRLLPQTTDEQLATAAEVLSLACPTQIVDNLAGVRWSKLAVNCATSTLGAIGGDTLGRLLRRRFVRRLALEIWAELLAVSKAEQITLAPLLPGFHVQSLAISDAERRHSVGSLGLLVKHSLLWTVGLKYRRMRSSTAIAIERGRMPETEWLNGEIVRRGAKHGIKTPVNDALVMAIEDLVQRRKQPGVATLHELYKQLIHTA